MRRRELSSRSGSRPELALLATAMLGCPAPDPGPEKMVKDPSLDGFVEVVPCKESHEHELHFVQIFADPDSAALFQTCVLDQSECDPFPVGSLFIKREYEYPGCLPDDFVSYTTSLKLAAGSYPDGYDWHWQRQDPDLTVVEDGAPFACVACHENHCSPPEGWDMRCIPD